MIIVMQEHATQQQIKNLVDNLTDLGAEIHTIYGETTTIIEIIDNKQNLSKEIIFLTPGVKDVVSVEKPYKLVSRNYKTQDTIVELENIKIGTQKIVVMAGPCAVESKKQLFDTAYAVKKSGAQILRGGAFKPRTSPYSFQGLQQEGLKLLKEVQEYTGLKIITEVMDTRDVELVAKYTDILQIGARNMQNYNLLREVGLSKKPVLLKRGISSTIDEWLMSAEYVGATGNENIILCERGIRTFESSTRNTLDLNAIPVIKKLSHLPIIVDPSHACGNYKYVPSLSKAAISVGADGLMIEVHNNPAVAKSDGAQSLTPAKFTELMSQLSPVAKAINRIL